MDRQSKTDEAGMVSKGARAGQEIKYLPLGDQGITIVFGNSISEEINRKVRGAMHALKTNPLQGVIELVPAYSSLTVYYDPLVVDYAFLCRGLQEKVENMDLAGLPQPKVFEIPTVYGGIFGPDLEFVAEHNKLSPEEVVNIHSSRDYLVYMLGFAPGFPYLGGLSEKIQAPRLAEPRQLVKAGSVGIAGNQTGIYSVDSPGGWRIIGGTPVKLYDPEQEQPVPLQAGDYLRFVPVSEDEFREIEEGMKPKLPGMGGRVC